jgi:hypothetical protein
LYFGLEKKIAEFQQNKQGTHVISPCDLSGRLDPGTSEKMCPKSVNKKRFEYCVAGKKNGKPYIIAGCRVLGPQ